MVDEDEDGVFSAISSYKVLEEGLLFDGEPNRLEEGYFEYLKKNFALLKVVAFS